MLVLFCSDPFSPKAPEEAYAAEAAAATAAGFETALIDHEALVAGDAREATRRVRRPAQAAIYRGWMLTAALYAELHAALRAREVSLVTSPLAYRHCHHLPASYAAIEPWTPRSVWLPEAGGFDLETLLPALASFEGGPVVLKDYVKSCKHAWEEACFIPDSSDRAGVERVVTNFLEWQGESLNEGLVFREFVELAAIGAHPKSGMPLTKEFRVFVWRGRALLSYPYWDEASYEDTELPGEWLMPILGRVESPFFTLDLAQRVDGSWIVVELGDGQVAGLPPSADPTDFYAALAEASG